MCRNFKGLGLLMAALCIPGCTGMLEVLDLLKIDVIDIPDPVAPSSPQLKAFASKDDLEAYFKGQIADRNAAYEDFTRGALETSEPNAPSAGGDGDSGGAGADAVSEAPLPGALSDGFSGTTTQEVGVDEADVVKTDGTNFYMIDNNYAAEGSILRIVRVNPADQMAVASEKALAGYGRDLYLRGDKVVAITTGGGNFFWGATLDTVAGPDMIAAQAPVETDASEPVDESDSPVAPPFREGEFVYERPHTLVTLFDVANPAAPVMLSQTKFDGTQSATRMIDGVLHMVVANYQEYYFDVLPRLGFAELDLAPVSVDTLLPNYERTNADGTTTAGAVVDWENLYYPADPDGFGVVTLVSLDVDNDAQFSAVGVVAEPGLIYSSLAALYLTNTQYDWMGNARTTTNLYKFAFEARGARPVAFGSVEGRVLNQYSMGEYQGNLRVATTIDAQWICGFFECVQTEEAHNSVYVLGQSDDTLSVLGNVTNIAPRETIQSARFIGDKGYVVTFEQTDPLFTIDLSDPANPRVVGQLEVPGFSTFLTPMDENHLLAVGQYVPPPGVEGSWGVQLSVFDVTDFALPVRTSNVIIGDQTGAYSEATWDPKAFTYFAAQGLVALPINIYPTYDFGGSGGSEDGDSAGTGVGSTGTDGVAAEEAPTIVDEGFDGLYVYRVTATEGLTVLGRMSTRYEETPYWGTSFTRGVFIGDQVFAVSNLGVREAAIGGVSTVEHEIFYGPIFEESPPITGDPFPPPPGTEVVGAGNGEVPVSEGGSGGTTGTGRSGGSTTVGSSIRN